jgi:hypothetical protein
VVRLKIHEKVHEVVQILVRVDLDSIHAEVHHFEAEHQHADHLGD